MVVITDCLSDVLDEGCIKITNSLVKKLKNKSKKMRIISYGNRKSEYSDKHLKLNKFFLNYSLYKELAKNDEDVLYIPQSSYTSAALIRTLLLSLYSKRVSVLFVEWKPVNKVKKFLLSRLKCNIYVMTNKTAQYLKSFSETKILHIKTGVDTKRFIPVSAERKKELRKKYNFSENETIILHVGHLKKGRGIESMLELECNQTPLLVVSTSTPHEDETKKKLKSRKNFRFMEDYIPNIEEIYQLSDCYLFPVSEKGNCIDIPLSAFEAASCGLPVVATKYGELEAFVGEKGFYFFEKNCSEDMNKQIKIALLNSDGKVNKNIFEYDWDKTVSQLLNVLA